MDSRYSELRLSVSDRLPIVTYTNLFLPRPSTVWMSPQVEHVTGYKAEEWVGCPEFFESVLHPDDRAAVMEDVYASRIDLRPFARDYRLLKRNGEVIWVHDESVPLFDEQGAPELIQGYFIDITPRKELELKLVQAEKLDALGRLATEVAHDFNNYLMAIQAQVELLGNLLAENSPERTHAHEIAATIERASTLTRRLLDYGRREQSTPHAVSLEQVIGDLEPLLARVAGPKVQLLFELHPTRDIGADPVQIERIVVNLVANARDAVPEGGTVSIRNYDLAVRRGLMAERLGVAAGDYVALVIADNGLGIDPATQRRIFEPFFTTKQAGRGTGLGLSIVDKIVRQAGGGIHLQSAPGTGSRFRILLPAAPPTQP